MSKAWVNEPICNFAVKLVFNSKLLIWPKFDFDWWTSVLLSMRGTYSQIIMSGKPAMIPGAFIQRTFNTNVYDDTVQDFRYFQHLMSFYQKYQQTSFVSSFSIKSGILHVTAVNSWHLNPHIVCSTSISLSCTHHPHFHLQSPGTLTKEKISWPFSTSHSRTRWSEDEPSLLLLLVPAEDGFT